MVTVVLPEQRTDTQALLRKAGIRVTAQQVAADSAEVRERLTAQGVDVALSAPENFAAFLRNEYARWGKVIRAAGIRAD